MIMQGNFYIVATPIGNISDITLRALDILKSVDYIACEDTRVTSKLTEKYGFTAKLFDCHKFNEKERSERIISILNEGKNIALVSDAGTPLISDPGSVLLRELSKNNINVTSLPGACAVTTFLSQIPRDNEEYAFIGFIPRTQNQQKEILEKYKFTNCVFYESPNRLLETLNNILAFFGEHQKVAIGRELTKIYEEVKIGTVNEIIDYYSENTLKGEIVAMVFAKESESLSDDLLKEKINTLRESGYSQKDISVIISKLYKENKNKIYKLALE